MRESCREEPHMTGFITEKHWRLIEKSFPGIKRFYQSLDGKKPSTFLELEWQYLDFLDQPKHPPESEAATERAPSP